jgi:CHAT domain-containing protein
MLTLTRQEQMAIGSFEVAGATLSLVATQLTPLRSQASRTPDEEQRLVLLNQQLASNRDSFLKALEEANTALQKAEGGASGKIELLPEVVALQATLNALEPGHVVLYTLATEESLFLLLITPEAFTVRTVSVKAVELQKQVQLFRALLQTPTLDPRPVGKKLYEWLITPLEAEMKGVKHLFLSLDPSIGAVPYAALYDGTRYVVEKWSTSLYTALGQVRLETVATNAKALTVGVSEGQGQGGPSLPGVAQEVRAIGQSVLLDQDFTLESWQESLRNDRCDICHIASVFELARSEKGSGLRLGSGKTLPLEEFFRLPKDLFFGLSLLTLSGLQLPAQGTVDTESLAVLVQRKGVQAVLANSWSVNDSATRALLEDFYRRWKRGGIGKAAALREAQLALLNKEQRPGEPALNLTPQLRSSSPARAQSVPAATAYPVLERRLHPFYWAGFALYGNSR